MLRSREIRNQKSATKQTIASSYEQMIRLPRTEDFTLTLEDHGPVHLNLRGGKSFCCLLSLICSYVPRSGSLTPGSDSDERKLGIK